MELDSDDTCLLTQQIAGTGNHYDGWVTRSTSALQRNRGFVIVVPLVKVTRDALIPDSSSMPYGHEMRFERLVQLEEFQRADLSARRPVKEECLLDLPHMLLCTSFREGQSRCAVEDKNSIHLLTCYILLQRRADAILSLTRTIRRLQTDVEALAGFCLWCLAYMPRLHGLHGSLVLLIPRRSLPLR